MSLDFKNVEQLIKKLETRKNWFRIRKKILLHKNVKLIVLIPNI